jgi:hypothetical protein
VLAGISGPSSGSAVSGPAGEGDSSDGVGEELSGLEEAAGPGSDAAGTACVLQAVQARSSPIDTNRFARIARSTLTR